MSFKLLSKNIRKTQDPPASKGDNATKSQKATPRESQKPLTERAQRRRPNYGPPSAPKSQPKKQAIPATPENQPPRLDRMHPLPDRRKLYSSPQNVPTNDKFT